MKTKFPSQVHESWYPILEEGFNLPEIKELKSLMETTPYSPYKEFLFKAFEMPVNKVRVVILGQDPYPNRKDAIGLAFATSLDNKKPASLKIIQQEVGKELPNDLSTWVDQGVLLLNSALTCEIGKPGSHLEYWKKFTELLVTNLSSYNQEIIWLFWGKHSKYFSRFTHQNSPVLEASHPASEKYNSGSGFIGCNHFNIVNLIISKFKKPISW